MLIYSFIPARKGSKRIPNKNIKKLNGIPLINYTINHCLKSKFINKTFVSSNDNKLLNQVDVLPFYEEYRGYPNSFYALLGLLFGFILSSLIIFFKSFLKENK